MRTMSTKRVQRVELPERFIKLLEETYITCLGLGKESAEVFSENFQKENPLIPLTRLLLAAKDDARARSDVPVSFLFRHARLDQYRKRAEELLGEKE